MDEATQKYLGRKIKTAEEIAKLIGAQPRVRKVIMCHGVFDIVHPGHLRHLIYAKSKGDILVASLTCDAHIRKANIRPFVPEALRAINLAALEMIDYVVIDREPTPLNNIRIIQPDYFAKGYEYAKGSLHPATAEEKKTVESYGGELIFTPGDVVYSSSHLIETSPPDIKIEKLMVLMAGGGLSFGDLRQALGKFKGLKVHVVGDTIVDSYSHCSMIGGMSKTPTISVRFEEKTDFVGGAGVVAKHLRAVGAEVTFSTVLGNDSTKDFVIENLEKSGVQCHAIIDPTRPTTNKNSIIASGYRLLKVDTLDNRTISEKIVSGLCAQIRDTAADIVVCSDFRHGIFNRQTIPALISAIPEGIFRVADSQVASRWGNILEFRGFDLITPNEREARFALADQDSVVRPLATALYERAGCKTLILKLGESGIITHFGRESDAESFFYVVDSFAGTVVDAVGAGDALLAYATLALKATGSHIIASILGSVAAGVECEHDGNIPVTPANVLKKIGALERKATFAAD